MADQTEKLEKFKQAVFNEAAVKADEIIKETKDQCSQWVLEAVNEAEEYVNASKEAADKEHRETVQRAASAENLNSKRNVLLCREAMINKVFENVRRELESFRQTADYENLLIKRVQEIANACPDKKGEVRVAEADMKFADKLTCGGRFTVTAAGNILLGGVMVVFSEDNLALDATFDNEYEKQRSSFAGKVGLAVNTL